MRIYTLAFLLGCSFSSLADSVRGDDVSCTNSDSNPMSIEMGVKESQYNDRYYDNNNFGGGNEVGISFKYEFGGPKRLDCSRLYDLILREKEAELKMLEAKIKALESASKIKW